MGFREKEARGSVLTLFGHISPFKLGFISYQILTGIFLFYLAILSS